MIRRKEYIENIIHSLALLQTETGINNYVNLYDNNIVAEDFMCGLLNLIYGYNFTNANHVMRNAPAIDLVDQQNRIAVQVTSTGSREKIQNTVDQFIRHELYKDYDYLWMLFLGDIPKLKKPIDTKGLLVFDESSNLLNIDSLTWEIRKLNTAKLKEIEAYLKEELDDRYFTKGGHDSKKSRRIWIVTAGVIALVSLAAFLFVVDGLHTNTPRANVYFSRVLPYSEAGYYASYDEISPIVRSEEQAEKAFSILSFVRNFGQKYSVIEQVYCDILQLEPIKEDVIQLDAEIVDNTWKLYAINNGWGDSETLKVDYITLNRDYGEEEEQLDIIASDKHITENHGVASAKAVLLAEYDLDSERYQRFCEENDVQETGISVKVSSGEKSYSWSAYLLYHDGKFEIGYGGMGNPGPQITLFAKLDVDSRPSRLTFTGPDSTPVVGDTLRIETVIAPTKSCEVTCRNVFTVNGKQQQTEIYTVKVDVPVFKDGAVGYTGMLTQELAQMEVYDEYMADRIAQKYLYDPEVIRENFQISD